MVIGVITTVLTRATGNLWMPLLGFLAFLGTTLRVSYHVFYQTSYLHLQKKYNLNRVTEGFTAEDETADPLTRRLQTAFLIVYGWQDRMMVRVDAWCRSEIMSDQHTWYSDRIGLRLSGFLGLGTELFILMTFSVFNALEGYLYVNLMAMNALWLACIVYRRVILSRRLRVQRNIL
jgi:hypothetical protein